MSDLRKGDLAKMPPSHDFRAGVVEIMAIIGGDAEVRYVEGGEKQRISLALLVRDIETRRLNTERKVERASKIGRK